MTSICLCCLLLTALQYTSSSVMPTMTTLPNERNSRLADLKIRLSNGFGKIMPNARLAEEIKRRKEKGEPITFTEYQFLRTATDDFWKLVRLVLTLGYSREFFAYGYVVGPLINPGPTSWLAWPSSFDVRKDKELRDKSLEEKRISSTVQVLNAVNAETNSMNKPEVQIAARKNVATIIRALRSNDLQTSLNEMKDFIFVDKKHQDKAFLKGCSGAVLKGMLNALGADGIPNIPIINRLNCKEVQGILEKIAKSDEVVSSIGVKNLSDREVRLAGCAAAVRSNAPRCDVILNKRPMTHVLFHTGEGSLPRAGDRYRQ